MMTPAQCRAARALLDWSQQRLAEAARIGNATIRNFENGNTSPQNATLDVLRRALENAGVVFIPQNGGAPAFGFGRLTARRVRGYARLRQHMRKKRQSMSSTRC
jgi:transcriptional regulator with XRE-family HTH domain